MGTNIDQMSDGIEGIGLFAVADVSDFFGTQNHIIQFGLQSCEMITDKTNG